MLAFGLFNLSCFIFILLFYPNCIKFISDACSLVAWTEFCLLIAPDVSTFWNIRKNLLLKNFITFESDLHLTLLALTRKPKCMEAFQQRRWLFDNFIGHSGNEKYDITYNDVKKFLISELKLCTWTANKHQNNYHAWNHRLWIIDKVKECINLQEVCILEYDHIHNWISCHVSEHSGLHYLQHLLNMIALGVKNNELDLHNVMPQFNSVQQLYLHELNFNRDLIFNYIDHEALFCHRRILLKRLRDMVDVEQRTCSPPPPALKRTCVETISNEWSAILLSEQKFIDSCLEYKSYQKVLGEKHSQWLSNVLAV